MKLIIAATMAAFMLAGCSKEQKAEVPAPASEGKNIFEEVKEQTVKNPQDAAAWYHLADLYERSQQYREEIDALNKVISITPANGNAYVKLGNACNRLTLYPEAVKNYKAAVKYFPKNPVLYNNLAVSYGKLGKTDEEIASLEQAISLRPRYSTARFNLGMAMLKKGRTELARKQYRELLKFDEGVAQSLNKEINAKRR